MSEAKVTATDVRAALKRYYPSPESAIVYEVAQSTGHAARRHLDAVAMELWPSRGLALNGIEIKVDLYDWRREKADPTKAEEIARFCDYFWIAAPKGVVPIAELPSAWGLLELMPEGKINPTKPAHRTEAMAIDRGFVAALLRAATRPVDSDTLDSLIKSRTDQWQADFDKRVEEAARQRTERQNHSSKSWEMLCAALGEEPSRWGSDEPLIAAIKAVHKSGVASSWNGIKTLIDTLERTLKEVREGAGLLNIDLETPKKKRRV